MEAGLAAGYAAETAVEGAVGAGIALAQSTMPLKATWNQIPLVKALPRSSHTLSIVKGVAYIFGGEIRPREPFDNDIHSIRLPSSGNTEADYKIIPAAGVEVPQARVGHTANAIGDKIYVFGGRGGKDMTPLMEKGRVWVFDTTSRRWTFLDPVDGSPYPEPRSYHAAAATAYPLTTSVDKLESRFDPLPVDSQAHGMSFSLVCTGVFFEADQRAFKEPSLCTAAARPADDCQMFGASTWLHEPGHLTQSPLVQLVGEQVLYVRRIVSIALEALTDKIKLAARLTTWTFRPLKSAMGRGSCL